MTTGSGWYPSHIPTTELEEEEMELSKRNFEHGSEGLDVDQWSESEVSVTDHVFIDSISRSRRSNNLPQPPSGTSYEVYNTNVIRSSAETLPLHVTIPVEAGSSGRQVTYIQSVSSTIQDDKHMPGTPKNSTFDPKIIAAPSVHSNDTKALKSILVSNPTKRGALKETNSILRQSTGSDVYGLMGPLVKEPTSEIEDGSNWEDNDLRDSNTSNMKNDGISADRRPSIEFRDADVDYGSNNYNKRNVQGDVARRRSLPLPPVPNTKSSNIIETNASSGSNSAGHKFPARSESLSH